MTWGNSCGITTRHPRPSPKRRKGEILQIGGGTLRRSANLSSCPQLPSSSGMPCGLARRRGFLFGVAGEQNFIHAGRSRTIADEFHQIEHFAGKMLAAADVAWIDDDLEHAVANLIDRLFANANAAGKGAGKNLHHQAQRESLVRLIAAERSDGARRIAVQCVRIVGRPALIVEQPTVGALLAGDSLHAHFAFGGGAGAEIHHQRSIGMRHADGNRIGAQPRHRSPRRRHSSRRAVGVDHQHRHHPGGGRLFAVFAQPADVAGVDQRSQRDAAFFRFGDQPFGQPLRLRLTKTPVAVGLQQRRGFLQHRELCIGFHFPFGNAVQIVRNAHHAVRIVPHQIRGDQAFAHQPGFVRGNAAGLEKCNRELSESFGGNGRHGAVGMSG